MDSAVGERGDQVSNREKRQREIAVNMLSQYIPTEMHLNALRKARDKKSEAGEDIAVLNKQIDRTYDKLIDLGDRIALLVDELPEVQRDIIVRTYIFGENQQSIEKDLNYSVRHIQRLKAQALTTIGIAIEHGVPCRM